MDSARSGDLVPVAAAISANSRAGKKANRTVLAVRLGCFLVAVIGVRFPQGSASLTKLERGHLDVADRQAESARRRRSAAWAKH